MDLLEKKKIDKVFKRHPWELTRLKILFSLFNIQSQKNTILDIGSGDAFVSNSLAKKFPNTQIIAIDINYDDEYILHYKEKPENLYLIKNFENLPVQYPVQIVLLMDVIEHIDDQNSFLKLIKSINGVTNNTSFFITVPAFQTLFSKHDIFLGHYRRYDRAALLKILKAEGFEIKQSGYFFFSLLLVRVFQKITGTNSLHGLHNYKTHTLINGIIKFVLWCDFKISWYFSRIGIRLPGLSCYCICNPIS